LFVLIQTLFHFGRGSEFVGICFALTERWPKNRATAGKHRFSAPLFSALPVHGKALVK